MLKEQIVGARMAGASVTKTAEQLSFSSATMSRTTTEFKNTEKPPATGVIPAGLPSSPT